MGEVVGWGYVGEVVGWGYVGVNKRYVMNLHTCEYECMNSCAIWEGVQNVFYTF